MKTIYQIWVLVIFFQLENIEELNEQNYQDKRFKSIMSMRPKRERMLDPSVLGCCTIDRGW